MELQQDIPSFVADVRSIPANGFPVDLTANVRELAAISELAGVSAIKHLHVNLMIRRWRRDGFQVDGKIKAQLEQPCRLTLEPVIQHIDEDFHATFIAEGSKLARIEKDGDGEIILDPEGDDLPDTFVGHKIDLWPVIIEHFVLAIDPFPQAGGAVLKSTDDIEDFPEDNGESPFAVLSELKINKNTGD